MSNYHPLVTVLMSVYNGEKFLNEAIESILNQTFKDFEFLIIDDGSTDNSLEIISQHKDPRIRVIANPENYGLAKTLNIGISLAHGYFIARADADDFYESTRLERQVEFLEKNQDIDVIGTWCKLVNKEDGVFSTFSPPVCHHVILWYLIFINPLAHPSVVFKKEKITQIGGYNENCRAGQDYDLWTRGGFNLKYANIPEYLTYLRKHDNNVTLSKSSVQRENWYVSSSHLMSELLSEDINSDITRSLIDPCQPLLEKEKRQNVYYLIALHAAFIQRFEISRSENYEITTHLSSYLCSKRYIGNKTDWIGIRLLGILKRVLKTIF